MSINTATLRKMILAVFSAEEFDIFCFDHYPSVYEQFVPSTTRLSRIQLLMEYCVRSGELQALLGLIKVERPKQVEQFEKQSKARRVAVGIGRGRRASEQPMQVDVAIEGRIEEYGADVLDELVESIAGILGIDKRRVRVMKVIRGSVIVRIALPAEAGRRLVRQYGRGGLVLNGRRVLWIRPVDRETELKKRKGVTR